MTYEPFITTIGTNGTITMPLLDAKTGGPPILVIGPVYKRNAFRFFAKMPSLEDAAQLPAPITADRMTVSYEPLLVYQDGPLPPHATGHIYRVVAGREKGKMPKKDFHLWDPDENTAIYPAAKIRIPTLKPDEVIEFEGVSHFFNPETPKYSQKGKPLNPFHWVVMPEDPPAVELHAAMMFRLLVKLHFLPLRHSKKRYHVVEGNPVQWAHAPVTPPRETEPEHQTAPKKVQED